MFLIYVIKAGDIEFVYDNYQAIGFIYQGNAYCYRRDIFGNVIEIIDSTSTSVVKYIYDAWGNHKVLDINGDENTTSTFIGNINPIRYRGYYFDVETGFYYLNSRYYDPEVGRFISADDINYIDPNTIGGVNIYSYCNNNPVMYVDPNGNAPLWSWLISGLQLVGGIALCFVPGAQAIGVSMIIGGSLGLIANVVSPTISRAIGGASSIANGLGAISTGISLLSFGVPGIIAGIGMMLVGGATMAFGANEIVSATTGTNYIQAWTGMSDGLYNGLYIGLNTASAIGSIVGNLGMMYSSNRILNNIIQYPSKVTNYKLGQIKTYGRHTTQWSVGTLNKGNAAGKGYALRQTYDGRYIQWHPAGSTWHANQNPYWKISSGALGKMWFDYITGLRFFP